MDNALNERIKNAHWQFSSFVAIAPQYPFRKRGHRMNLDHKRADFKLRSGSGQGRPLSFIVTACQASDYTDAWALLSSVTNIVAVRRCGHGTDRVRDEIRANDHAFPTESTCPKGHC